MKNRKKQKKSGFPLEKKVEFSLNVSSQIKAAWIDCRKTKTGVITSANHREGLRHHQPIKTQSEN